MKKTETTQVGVCDECLVCDCVREKVEENRETLWGLERESNGQNRFKAKKKKAKKTHKRRRRRIVAPKSKK